MPTDRLNIPPGWDYNPAAWSQRLPVIVLAMIGFVIATYLSYLVDAITGAIGGRARWRTMPWIVILFGLAVGPLGVVSVMLVVFQPLLFDAWCTLCLASAIVSLVMIGPAMDEFLASLQHLKRASDEGMSLWRVFWGLSATA
jgi:hypothetical protein